MKRASWIALAAGTLIAAGAAAAVWFTAPVSAIAVSQVSATGFETVPALLPLLLVVAAALVARAMARGVAARVLGVCAGLAVIGVVIVLVRGAGGGEAALAQQAAASTGVAELSGQASATGWGWVSIAGGVVMLAGAVGVMLAARSGRTTDRFERPGGGPRGTAPAPSGAGSVDDWDALTRGEDPSDSDRPSH